ncbi:MAG: AAA family ATPase, partial [Polyangiaceae bacterium]|nr:AAA family ATPase [Polyangiaceae bacterium]
AMFLSPLSALLCDQSPRKAAYSLTKTAIHTEAELAEAELTILSGKSEETWQLVAARTGKPALDSAMGRWARERRKAIEANLSASAPVLCYYPAVRFYLHEGFQKRRARAVDVEIPQLAAYDNAFEIGQQSFEGVVDWFRREEDLENEVRLRGESGGLNPRLDAVRQAVLRFMDRLSPNTFDELRVRRDPLDASKAGLVLRKEGHELDLHNLSDGERGCLVLVADLAQRLAAANPGAPDPLAGVGIVLIDEIELHLHPRWQREILPALCDTFPGCQLIVATHSPHILSRVPREQILLLSKFHVVERLPHTEGRDTNAILAELMGVPKRPDDAAEAIDDLAHLIDREDFSAAHRKLSDLEKRFGPDDQDLLHLSAMMRALEDPP